jgi:hypothetical protein
MHGSLKLDALANSAGSLDALQGMALHDESR